MRKSAQRFAAAILLTILAGPAVARQTKSPAMPARDDVAFVHQSWGAVIERWSVKQGAVEFEAPQKPGFNGGPVDVEVKRFNLTSAQRRELSRRLAVAEKAIGLPDKCSNYIPDGPYGSVSWKVNGAERVLKFTGSCMAGPNSVKASAGFRVGRLVSDAAKNKPVVETKRVD